MGDGSNKHARLMLGGREKNSTAKRTTQNVDNNRKSTMRRRENYPSGWEGCVFAVGM